MEKLVKAFIRRNYTGYQGAIADQAKISRGFMSDWMNGKRGISVKKFEAACKAVHIDWCMLAGEENG